MSARIFNKDGSFRGYTIVTSGGDYSQYEETGILKRKTRCKHSNDNAEMSNKELVEFCLNCKKPNCKYGTCEDYEFEKIRLSINKNA